MDEEAAPVAGRVAADRAIAQRRGAGIGIDPAAAPGGGVARDRAIGQRRGAEISIDPAASPRYGVARDGAIGQGGRACVVQTSGEPRSADVSLKRQWDSELEAELEAALSGFDPKSFDTAGQRRSRSERVPDPPEMRGQEGTPGKRTGKVIGLRGKSLFVDLGGKSEGVLPIEQLEGAEPPAPGADIEVIVDRYDPDEGVQILRLKGAAVEANWENRPAAASSSRPAATKVVKGGLEVDVDGIRGFMPISQIDLARVEDASAYLNQKFKAIVTEANPREQNLVLSRRDLLEQERAEMREKTWASLEEGQVREGTVRSVKDFGAFVDLGGVDGLLPIGEMSWSRVARGGRPDQDRRQGHGQGPRRSTRPPASSRWASSSSRPVPGRTSRRNTRGARWSRAA